MEHLQSFGLIVQGFARAENLMQVILSAVYRIHLTTIILLTNGLQYAGKREAALVSLRAVEMPAEMRERIAWLLGEVNKFSALRNAISHSNWTKGTRPGSVKPYQMKTRGGTLTLFGTKEDEDDHTIDELRDAANALIAALDAADHYLEAVGLRPLLHRAGRVAPTHIDRLASPPSDIPSA